MAISRTGKLTAVGTVVIGHHQESGIRIDRLAVEGQVFNALRLRVDRLTLAVIFRRLGDVNLVVHAVDHVEVVGAEAVPVNQRLRLAAVWVNLVKLSGRTLQPLFYLFPGGFNHHQRIRVEIEIGGITEGELALFDLHIACRVILTPAHFEWRCGGEYRQFRQIRIALHKVFGIGFLRHVDDLDGRIVLHQRQEAVHVVGGFADRLADEFARGVVIVLQHVDQFFIFRRQRFFRRSVVNRARFGF